MARATMDPNDGTGFARNLTAEEARAVFEAFQRIREKLRPELEALHLTQQSQASEGTVR